jgi:hypothetical protein
VHLQRGVNPYFCASCSEIVTVLKLHLL